MAKYPQKFQNNRRFVHQNGGAKLKSRSRSDIFQIFSFRIEWWRTIIFGSAGGVSVPVCGAIIGGVAALGLTRGKGTIEGKKDPSLFPLCAELYRRFGTEIETSHFCADITGTDFTKPEEAKAYMNSPEKIGRCIRLAGKTAALVGDMLSREGAKSSSAGVKSSSR